MALTQFGELTKVIYEVLTKELPSLKKLTDYLNSLINILLKLNKPIIWITPNGLKINLSTIKFESVKTTSRLLPNSKPVTISLPTKELNKVKIRRSFMPNLIHSLDASNIHLLISKLDNMCFYTIHDCFATSANNMLLLDHLVKLTFIEIYLKDGNYLERMHSNIQDQIKSFAPHL